MTAAARLCRWGLPGRWLHTGRWTGPSRSPGQPVEGVSSRSRPVGTASAAPPRLPAYRRFTSADGRCASAGRRLDSRNRSRGVAAHLRSLHPGNGGRCVGESVPVVPRLRPCQEVDGDPLLSIGCHTVIDRARQHPSQPVDLGLHGGPCESRSRHLGIKSPLLYPMS
jgi:hypothetical protein